MYEVGGEDRESILQIVFTKLTLAVYGEGIRRGQRGNTSRSTSRPLSIRVGVDGSLAYRKLSIN